MSEFPKLTALDRMRAMLCSLYIYKRSTNEFHTVHISLVRIQTGPAATEQEVLLSASVFRKAEGISFTSEELHEDLQSLKDPDTLSVAVCIVAAISSIPDPDAKNWMLTNYLSYLTDKKVREVVAVLAQMGFHVERDTTPGLDPQEREAHQTTIEILEGLDPSGHE